MERLAASFFARPGPVVASELVGHTLYRLTPQGMVSGRIVEVEAYGGANDPASHAYRRRTPRNSVMFGPPGHLYVYFTYGMHHCSNIVTETDGVAGAVLLRAVEPVAGLELMSMRRGVEDPRLLARGPGRLCRAFALTLEDNGTDLQSAQLWIGGERTLAEVVQSSYRIGVEQTTDRPWRFYEPGPWTSGPRAPRTAPGS